ncbi:phage anti-repressor protein AntB [Escherichia coli]|uniref:Phage anti-repressor protein AntB n=1 Tax=Escherichia coli TaxID=562 RepID=A0A376W5C3_ECOLX|nr:phage anti-repressor protein AntB [Escherichia coli]
MTNQLIPVFNGSISNQAALLCNARNLHAFLGVGKRFASWITERIAEYGFVENQDYMIASQIREAKGRGGHNRKEYHLTLDTAKELAMVERNEKGRQIRRYFIECEKKLRTFSQYKQNHSRNSQPRKSSSFATCSSGWKKPRTSANTCIPS